MGGGGRGGVELAGKLGGYGERWGGGASGAAGRVAGSLAGRRVAQLSAELCMNVVAPHLSLKSHRSWQAPAVVPAFWMDQPWHSPSVASLTYDGGGGEGGTLPGGNGGGEAHDEHQHSRLADGFDAPQLKSFALVAPVLPAQCIFPPW